MRELTKPLPMSDIFSLVWTKTKSSVSEYLHRFSSEVVTVTTNSGPVKGFKIASACDYRYYNFIGIPYAKPPIGDLRFKDPQPLEPSEKIINQSYWRNGTIATQPDLVVQRTLGGEDCLHLSVYTRDIRPNTLKPVMVWIHGGAFIIGSKSKDLYSPDFLLRNDVVLIPINYRLGAFGFASLKDPELGIPGNAGLKDQVMALRWIKENCMHFGGDPENITIFGESAGSASVSLHMLSDLSKGLFHKAIMMSGNAIAPWVLLPVDDWTQRVAKKLGWNGQGGDKSCLSVLQRASPDDIIKAQDRIVTLEDRKQYIFFPFGTVIEPYESAQCFLNKNPLDLLESAWSKDVPVIAGHCTGEGLLVYKDVMRDPGAIARVNLAYTLPFHECGIDVSDPQCREIAEKMEKFYFGFSGLSDKTVLVYLMIMTDRCFAHPIHRLILSRVKSQTAPTYLLRFNFDSRYSFAKRLFAGRNVPGACHADDCSYYFLSEFAGPIPSKNSDEWKTIERMSDTFTTFARSGDPNNNSLTPVHWKPVTLETANKDDQKYKCLNVSKDVSYIDWPELERMHYWDNVYKQFNNNTN